MPLKNQALTVTYLSWDTVNNIGKTGDAGNQTIRGVGDGGEYTPAASPVEVDAVNLKGIYSLALTAGEMNYNFVSIGGVSSSTGIVIYPVSFATDRGVLPTVAPGTANGIFIAGNNAPTSITGTSNSAGLTLTGQGTGPGILSTGGATGHAFQIVGGGTSGDGINITTTSGAEIRAALIQGDLGGRVLGNTATAFAGYGAKVAIAGMGF